MFSKVIKSIYESFLNLLYPPFCLHCHGEVAEGAALLCLDCSSLLALLDGDERCIHCFGENQAGHSYCYECDSKGIIFTGCASVFPYQGPASSIIKKMKYSDMPHLCRGVAAFMIAQFLTLKWPIPEMIVPVPLSLSHYIQRGFNQSLLIAECFSEYFNVPVSNILLREKHSYSQAGLMRYQREKLSSTSFFLKKDKVACNQRILLIDDVYTTGTTLRCCGEILIGLAPSDMYALTFCRA